MKCYNEACINNEPAMLSGCLSYNECTLNKDGCIKVFSEPPFKYGDEIEVQRLDGGDWIKRLYIAEKDNHVLCHAIDHNSIERYSIERWKYWRRPSPSLTWEDRDKLRGKWVRSKVDGVFHEKQITCIFIGKEGKPHVSGIGYLEILQENWEFLDGTPIK